MSRKLAALLQKPEYVVAKAIDELEARAGYPSADVRLLAENHQSLRSKIAQLGLDADDTTGQELYHALLARFGRDAARVDTATGSVPEELRLDKAIELVEHCGLPEVWALKSSAIKKLLKSQPPKRTTKILGYRSLDSMLKRENSLILYVVASAAESAAWQKTLSSAVAKLDSTNFETRQVRILHLDKRYSDLRFKNPVIVNPKAGLAVVVGTEGFKVDPVLGTALRISDALRACNIRLQKDIVSLHPTMVWWAGTNHLIASQDGQPVSLNIHDVATNHSGLNDYGDHTNAHGAESLWQTLTDRYTAIAGEFKEPELANNLSPEYAEVEA